MHVNGQPILVAKTKNAEFLAHWRAYPYPLTDKLQAAKGSVQLKLMSQGWIKPSWWDVHLLKINEKLLFQREILMKHDEVVYWYARTIIPQFCYRLAPDFFNRLEKESLMHLIFDTAEVRRTSLINYPVNAQCIEFNWLRKYVNFIDPILLLRFSQFSFQEEGVFYLAELLLPELEHVP